MSIEPSAVYVLDDDQEVNHALARLLHSAGYTPLVFHSPLDFLRAHDPAVSGCLILDEWMPVLGGRQVQTLLNAADCARPIIFLSGIGTIPMTVDAVRGGAVDFLPKPVDSTMLFNAVDKALAIDAQLRRGRHALDALSARVATLTPREREVMEHVLKGRLNKQIAADLGTVEKTVKVHRARVMQKMQARSLPELVHFAMELDSDTGYSARDSSAEHSFSSSQASHLDHAVAAGTATFATWEWDIRNDCVMGDAHLARLFGLSSGANGQPADTFRRAIHPQDLPRVDRHLREAIETGREYEATYRIVRTDGAECLVAAQGRSESIRGGSTLRLAGAMTEIRRQPPVAFTRNPSDRRCGR